MKKKRFMIFCCAGSCIAILLMGCGRNDSSDTKDFRDPTDNRSTGRELDGDDNAELAIPQRKESSAESETTRTKPYGFITSGSVDAVTGSYRNEKLGITIPGVTENFVTSTHSQLNERARIQVENGDVNVPEELMAEWLNAHNDTFLHVKTANELLEIQMYAYDGDEAEATRLEHARFHKATMAEFDDTEILTQRNVSVTDIEELKLGKKEYCAYSMFRELKHGSGMYFPIGATTFVTNHKGKMLVYQVSFANLPEVRSPLIRLMESFITKIDYE